MASPEPSESTVEPPLPAVGPDLTTFWEEDLWEALVQSDRRYFEIVDPDDMTFPDVPFSRRIPLIGEAMGIGRKSSRLGTPEIDLSGSLEDVGVSRRHAVLMRQPDGTWSVVDKESANGTYVNYAPDPIPANEPVPLEAGDRVHVGAWTTLIILREEAAPPSREISVPSFSTRNVARPKVAVDIRLLGPLELVVSGRTVPVGALQVRQVLAVLAMRVGSAVSMGELEEVVWLHGPPATGQQVLKNLASALRDILGSKEAIEKTPHGYRLVGTKDIVDVFRFERLAERGRRSLDLGHPAAAVAELDRALKLWRGEALEDLLEHPSWAGEASRLEERRDVAVEDRFDGRLQLGDHRAAIPDLRGAVADRPLRERRRRQLMLAHYRDGQQDAALKSFNDFRESLIESSGLDPGPEIDALNTAIVMDRPELRWTPPGENSPSA
jgi:DNA-binding SARP family transcriptional activator